MTIIVGLFSILYVVISLYIICWVFYDIIKTEYQDYKLSNKLYHERLYRNCLSRIEWIRDIK